MKQRNNQLLLLAELVSLGICGLLGTNTVQPLEGTSLTDCLEGLEILHLLCNGHGACAFHNRFNSHDSGSGQLDSLGQLLRSSVTLPGLLSVNGEQNHLGLVFLQSLGVQLEGLHALVPAPVVHGDTDSPGVLLAQTSGLNLLQGETTAQPLLQVVFVGRAGNDGPDLAKRTRSNTSSLGHTVLPILVEVAIWHNIVPLCRHSISCRSESSNKS